MAKIVGKLSGIRIVSLVYRTEWTVREVQYILMQDGQSCQSGNFEFCSGVWTHTLMRVVVSRRNHVLCVNIKRDSPSSHKNHVECKLIRTYLDGREELFLRFEKEADKGTWNHWVTFDLDGENLSLMEDGSFHLKVVCILECFECKSEEMERFSRLTSKTQEWHIGGEGGDLRINVKDKLFIVHKNIMRERSPVFDAMFRHDMLEAKTGEVHIADCEPKAFQIFLDYLHSDKLEIDSMETVYNLYTITDKYEVSEAKAECVNYMLENLDTETFCDVVTVSLRHVDTELTESAFQFFRENSGAIMRTRRWRAFRRDYPAAVNDFLTRVDS